MLKKVELLAPAGSYDAFLVAIASGADAVYISGKSFGARAFAPNFTNEEIEKAVKVAHIFSKKVYVTINTLIYNNEMDEVSAYIDFLYNTNVDALIVQDLGIVNLIKKKYPDFIVHASTQMSIYNETGINNLKRLGISRAILAREVTLEKVTELCKQGLEIEIFVHGALCYAYSGNCLMSYAIGKRSGNRGACAQPCRKLYTLLENDKPIVSSKSLLSMKDLQTINDLDKIIASGVTSLKIEGRMKSLEYVKTIVELYRRKIDEYYNSHFKPINEKMQKKINVTFNRGFTKGYLLNDLNSLRQNYNSVNHQGIKIGKIIKVNNKKITIKLSEELNFNDGIRFKGKKETGLYVNEIYLDNILVKYAPAGSTVTIITNSPANDNDEVYKTVDAKLQKDAIDIVKNFPLKKKINFNISILYGQNVKLIATVDDYKVEVIGNTLNDLANNPLDVNRISAQLSKLNDTYFIANSINVNYDNKCFISIKDINEIRRNAVNLMEEVLFKQVQRNYLPLNISTVNNEIIDESEILDVVVFNELQKEVCEKYGISNIYFNNTYNDRFENRIKKYAMIHNLGQFDDENCKLVPSIYMNIINNESIDLLKKLGFKKAYLSAEVEIDMINDFSCDDFNIGYFIYGREDLMVSNQCFIASSCNFESKKCMMCQKNNYSLLDEFNNEFPILTDIKNCDIRILNNNIKNEISKTEFILNSGIKHLLLIFTTETTDEVAKVIQNIKKAIKTKF